VEKKTDKQNLSKNLLNMKFMQRYTETELRKKLQDEQDKAKEDARWVITNNSSLPTVTYSNESTFDFTAPRLSFLQFNPSVEKSNQPEDEKFKTQTRFANNEDLKTTHSDSDMATNSSFAVKRKRKNADQKGGNYYSRNKKVKKSLEVNE